MDKARRIPIKFISNPVRKQYLVPAIKRSFDVIDLLAQKETGLTVSEIHRALRLPLSSAAAIRRYRHWDTLRKILSHRVILWDSSCYRSRAGLENNSESLPDAMIYSNN